MVDSYSTEIVRWPGDVQQHNGTPPTLLQLRNSPVDRALNFLVDCCIDCPTIKRNHPEIDFMRWHIVNQ